MSTPLPPLPIVGNSNGTWGDMLNAYLTAISTRLATAINPSGDTSGTTDTAAIQAALTAGNRVILGPGDFYIGAVGNTNPGLNLPGASDTTPGSYLEGSGHGRTRLLYVGSGIGLYSHGTETGTGPRQGKGTMIKSLELDGSMVPPGATTTGIDVGDQYNIVLEDVTVSNFIASGTTNSQGANPLGAVGICLNNATTLTEKCFLKRVVINNCGTPNLGASPPNQAGGAGLQFVFQGAAHSTSHMYSDIDVQFEQQPGQNCIVCGRFGHIENSRLVARGNMFCTNGGTNNSAFLVLGVANPGGGSPQPAHIARNYFDVHVETTSGNIVPYFIYVGTNADNTINHCHGRLQGLDGFQATNINPANNGTFEFSGPMIGSGLSGLQVPATLAFVSGTQYTYSGVDCMIMFKASGAITDVNYNGTTVLSNVLGGPFILCAGMTIKVTYTGVLTVAQQWFGQG